MALLLTELLRFVTFCMFNFLIVENSEVRSEVTGRPTNLEGVRQPIRQSGYYRDYRNLNSGMRNVF